MANPAWVRGVSGNPRGRPSYVALREMLFADLNAKALTATDRTLLEQAASMLFKARSTKSIDQCARLTNSALRIIRPDSARGKRRLRPDLAGGQVESGAGGAPRCCCRCPD